MKLLRLSAFWLGFTLCNTASAQDLVTPSDRVSTHVNVRGAADISAAEIGQLEVGEGLPLVSRVPLWYEVELASGSTGFVSKAWTTVARALVPRQEEELRVHFLDVGAGTCTVVECPGPGAPPMIVDCGSTGATDVDMDAEETRTYVLSVLLEHQEAPNVVLSHADLDHYRYVASTLDGMTVASIWQGGDPSEYTSADFPAWLAVQLAQGAVVHQNFPADFHNNGEPLTDDLSCGLASTFVLTVNSGTSKNAKSLVLMIEYQDFTAILSGDAEGITEDRALENYANSLKATVLTASHHGASTNGSNSEAWALLSFPDVLVSSAGNRFLHPRCEATNRFTSLAWTKEHEIRCGSPPGYTAFRTNRAHYVTEVNGTIIITSNGRSPVTVNCTRSVECGISISH